MDSVGKYVIPYGFRTENNKFRTENNKFRTENVITN